MKTIQTVKVELTTSELVEFIRHHLKLGRDATIEVEIVKPSEPVPSEPAVRESPNLWYPDNSGEWVEVANTRCPPELEDDVWFEYLLRKERNCQTWCSSPMYVDTDPTFWAEDGEMTVVAYKKVDVE